MPATKEQHASAPAPANTLGVTSDAVSLEQLPDDEYLAVSHEFGQHYARLVTGGAETNSELFSGVQEAAEPYLRAIEDMDDETVAATLIKGYREGFNGLHTKHEMEAPFAETEVTAADLSHVKRVERSPLGIPILYTDDNEALFRHDSASFASPRLMLEQGLPPLVVVSELIPDSDQIAVHESSHAVWGVMEQAGLLPQTGEKLELGYRSALDTARDEAVAMQLAGQGKIIHPNVIRNLKQEGYDEDAIERYRSASYRYADAMHGVQGIEQQDSIFGFMQAKDWDGFMTHVERMTTLAEAAPHDAVPELTAPKTPDNDGWAAA